MGGDSSAAPADSAPVLLIRARRDPDDANLDREIGADGRCRTPVGDKVDVRNASELPEQHWRSVFGRFRRDPEFDPEQRAFHYVRVIAIPTPAWIAFDERIFGTTAPPQVGCKLQGRACTSPIRHTP